MFEVIRQGSKWLVDAKTLWGRCVDGDEIGSERQFRVDELAQVKHLETYHSDEGGGTISDEDVDDMPTEKITWN